MYFFENGRLHCLTKNTKVFKYENCTYDWIKSYLSIKIQVVITDNKRSTPLTYTMGWE